MRAAFDVGRLKPTARGPQRRAAQEEPMFPNPQLQIGLASAHQEALLTEADQRRKTPVAQRETASRLADYLLGGIRHLLGR
jgi:hypothetical protein